MGRFGYLGLLMSSLLKHSCLTPSVPFHEGMAHPGAMLFVETHKMPNESSVRAHQ